MPHALAVQIVSIMALWVMFLSALRFSANMAVALHPLGVSLLRTANPQMSKRQRRSEFYWAMDSIKLRFQIAMCTPWSLPLLLGGLFLIGLGLSFGSTGDVVVLVSRYPERWTDLDRYLDWISALSGCVGMAIALAALSKRRTASVLISSGFAITGLGIGVIAAVYLK